jgi:3-oxoacyl-[acyl-carrier-protein] synthase II
MRRVVITGIGAITPLGATLAATRDALAAGRTAVAPATLFDASGFACALAAEVRDWDPRPSFRAPKALKLTDRPARFAVAAAEMALADARWPAADQQANEALGVAVGSSGSDLQARDLGRALAGDGDGRVAVDVPVFADRILRGLNPLWLLVSLPNMTSAHVAIQLQARGPNTTVMSDWAAGHQAIGEAAEWIRGGEADAVLAGGADCGIQPFVYAAYQQAGLFDAADGDAGFVPGEGAAMFLLESRDAALARGAVPYAEVAGYGAGSGGAGRGLAQSLCDAMTRAGWTRSGISGSAVAAPALRRWSAEAARVCTTVAGDVPQRTHFEPRLGHPLAAAAPIDLALTLRDRGEGRRLLSSAVGCSTEAVTLAIDIERQPSPGAAPRS